MTAQAQRAARHSWLGGLDGLRAIAVIAVMTFHFTPTLLPGGFLGVDLFFVISGFLITRLLLAQLDVLGGLEVLGFYRRRARRLLPALLLVIAAAILAGTTLWRDQLPTLRGNAVSGLFFGANWWLLGDRQSYFVTSGRPPLLQHLWSLAIEEQFYLLFPLLLGLVIAPAILTRSRPVVLRPRHLSRLVLVALVLAGLSTAVMAVEAIRGDVPYGSDSSRVYYGTDTHSMGLLVGVAAGALASRSLLPGARRRRGFWRSMVRGAFLTDVVAVLALALLIQAMRSVDEFDPDLYRGGFLLFSLLAVVVVMSVVRGGSLLGWALERRPLVWVGQRSYALYLWHWPVAVLTRPGVDLWWPTYLVTALRLVVTLALAELTYRFVEVPVRDGVPQRLVTAWLTARRRRILRRRVAPISAFVALLVASTVGSSAAYSSTTSASGGAPVSVSALAVMASATSQPTPRPGPRSGPVGFGTTPSVTTSAPLPGVRDLTSLPSPRITAPATPTGPGSAAPAPDALGRAGVPSPTPAGATAAPTGAAAAPATPAAGSPRPVAAVSAFGDSVMLGATQALQSDLPQIAVHAAEGRQARPVFAEVTGEHDDGTLSPDVVIQAGDNGIVSPADLTTLLQLLSDRARVVLVTDRVPKDWQDPNNSVLRGIGAKFPNVVVADWCALSDGHPDWFYRDGLHLPPVGAQQYAAMIAQALERA